MDGYTVGALSRSDAYIDFFFFFFLFLFSKDEDRQWRSLQHSDHDLFSVAKVSKGAWKDFTTVLTVSIDRGRQAKASASETHAPFSIFSYLHRTDHSLQ